MCFKYFKNKKHEVQVILPGKLTPYMNSSIEDNPNAIEYPYENGLSTHKNQQVFLLNGKYRHIASYTLDELRSLGWYGTVYNGGTCDGFEFHLSIFLILTWIMSMSRLISQLLPIGEARLEQKMWLVVHEYSW